MLFLLMLSHRTWAEECKNTESTNQIDTSFYDKETVKQALMVLLETQALTVRLSKGIRINRDLIEELRRDGLIQVRPIKEAVICVDPK